MMLQGPWSLSSKYVGVRSGRTKAQEESQAGHSWADIANGM